jgi:hypothetical protein
MHDQPSAASSADTRRLRLVENHTPTPPASLWRQEGEAAQHAGADLERAAELLPEHSDLREDLLACAQSFRTLARLHGVAAPASAPRLRLV